MEVFPMTDLFTGDIKPIYSIIIYIKCFKIDFERNSQSLKTSRKKNRKKTAIFRKP